MRICHCTRSTPVTASVIRMLHLETRIHLQEVKASDLVHKEFDGAGIRVSDRSRDGSGRVGEGAT
jgi:hypothetical protein